MHAFHLKRKEEMELVSTTSRITKSYEKYGD